MKSFSAAALLAVCVTANAKMTVLSSFDESKGPVWEWKDMNDPVMGGGSSSTFVVDHAQKVGVFNGTCAIVKFLKAPGFAKSFTEPVSGGKFPDVSAFVNGTFQLRARTTTPGYKGYKLAWSATGVPPSSRYVPVGSFKAGFELAGTNWQVVKIPMKDFSRDWSAFTGDCDTKDPTGQQHYCCTDEHPEMCPTADFLSKIESLEVWAEGFEGDFHLELDWIAAGQPDADATTHLVKADLQSDETDAIL